MHDLKTCQCGGRPVWTPAERNRRRGRVPASRPERLRCPACGNATGPSPSREQLADEWNSAGWCGQGPEDERLEPFGPAWQAQCMRMRKPELVELHERACRRGLALDGLVARLRGELAEADGVIARLRVRRNRRELAMIIDRLVQRGIIEKADAAGAGRKPEVIGKRSEVRGQRAIEGLAFETFAELYPHEAYELDPDKMVAYAQKRNPTLSVDDIKRLLAETEGGGE